LVALPRLSHGQKAACPRCGATLTTEWDAPRQRPTAYALAALFTDESRPSLILAHGGREMSDSFRQSIWQPTENIAEDYARD
ncbi:hypothetical protein MJL48_35385, partial [Salmonella enterica subsp. enterica serovar Kentucky]|nr:hypothetical protein [Salmonella enterica subsp. enterica serovar Kentucky]